MLKRFAALLCALLLAGMTPSIAEDPRQCYAGFFDEYWHAHPACALAGTVAPIDMGEAVAQGKYPCPVCVDDEAPYGDVHSVVRGGTLVIRVPDRWMEGRPAGETADNFSYRYDDYAEPFFGGAGFAEMARQLHGAKYRKLLAAWQVYEEARPAGESAEAIRALAPEIVYAREPGVVPVEGGLLMHQRHIGGAWYLVYRPGEAGRNRLKKDGRLDVDLYFTVNALRAEGAVDDGRPGKTILALDVFPGGLWEDKAYSLKPVKSKNTTDFEAAAEANGASLTLTVFRDMDCNICVVHQNPTTPEALEEAALLIDGSDRDIRLSGYADGWYGTFCGVLTDAELEVLMGGASFELRAAREAGE